MNDAADVGLLATRHLFYILHGIKTKNQNNMSKQMILFLRMLTCGSQKDPNLDSVVRQDRFNLNVLNFTLCFD